MLGKVRILSSSEGGALYRAFAALDRFHKYIQARNFVVSVSDSNIMKSYSLSRFYSQSRKKLVISSSYIRDRKSPIIYIYELTSCSKSVLMSTMCGPLETLASYGRNDILQITNESKLVCQMAVGLLSRKKSGWISVLCDHGNADRSQSVLLHNRKYNQARILSNEP